MAKNGLNFGQTTLNYPYRAVLVACVFRVVLGGGRFHAPLTRLLGYVATRGKRQLKERQK